MFRRLEINLGLIDGVGIFVDRATHIHWPQWEKELEKKIDVSTHEASVVTTQASFSLFFLL